MKETVRETRHPWLVGVAVAVIAGAYFFFLGTSKYPEPGANLNYDIKEYTELDDIETRWEEVDEIPVDVETPRGMAVVGDEIYVAGTNAVVVIGPDKQEVARYEFEGEPNCMAVGPDGKMYVAMPNEVQVLSADGEPLARWTDFVDRSYITSIAVDEEDAFLADAGKHMVYRYSLDGERQVEIGRKDEDRDIPGIFVPSPYLDLALNEEGHLWVVNPGELGLERYRRNGDIVTGWYHPTLELHGFSGCCNPTHIAFNSEGRLITGEKGLVRLKVYEVTAGTFEELIVGSKAFPKEASLRDLAVDAQDRVLALDPRTDSIRVFVLKEDADVGKTS